MIKDVAVVEFVEDESRECAFWKVTTPWETHEILCEQDAKNYAEIINTALSGLKEKYIAAGIEEAKRKCNERAKKYECKNAGHDSRWCAYCENSSDGAEECFMAIDALSPSTILKELEDKTP